MTTQGMRQKVKGMSLSLTYPDGETAEFTGHDLYADVVFEAPDLPALDAQDAAPYAIARPRVRKLRIEITLDLHGQMSVQTHPAQGGGGDE